jgi:O-antigen ligase
LPLAIHQARHAPPGLRRRRWLQVALIGATLPMTVSRTAIVGLLVGGIVVVCSWPKRDRRLAYLVSLCSALVMEAVIPGLLGTLRGLFLGIGTDASAKERTAAFNLAGPLISHHFWLGKGFGTLLPQIYFFTDDQYLNTLVEIGAIGLLALLTLFVAGWSVARSVRRMTTDEESRHLAQCLAASIAVAAATYATFDALGFEIAAGLTFLLLGVIGALWRLTRDPPAQDALGAVSDAPAAARPASANSGLD